MRLWENIERRKLRNGRKPAHVAIIMDGNGTWARRRGLPRGAGHARGADALRRTLTEAAYLGIPCLTVFAFSTENWKRPPDEVEHLLGLFKESLQKEIPELCKNKIAVRFLGGLEKFSPELRELMRSAEAETKQERPALALNVLLNYGGRDELVRAVNKALNSGVRTVTEETFAKYLCTAGLPDPDLLIRTSGQLRISNFLLWQCAYTEFWFTPKCWPDFDGRLFRQAVRSYQKRRRRLGGAQDEKF
ncbi:MAG: di-trans,poly-cis-decaprenylcistransferase [Candidatus Margulisbacteria bacterium]|jgi:undecaprenyl diphosphate synthase|nr:di-trans,poly-cis-decaprenylcistransferase [Candidatus Margulisiibacteriota bacterium]